MHNKNIQKTDSEKLFLTNAVRRRSVSTMISGPLPLEFGGLRLWLLACIDILGLALDLRA